MSVAFDHHTGPWTANEVLALPDDGTHSRYELIDGALIVSPAPGVPHQWASRRLANLLEHAAYAAGIDVRIIEAINVDTPSGLTVPDIAIVEAHAARTATARIASAHVIAVVEIMSPSTSRLDRLVKPSIYAEAGIGTYWRLELDPTPKLVVSALHAGCYVESITVQAGVQTRVSLPYPITLDPQDLIRI